MATSIGNLVDRLINRHLWIVAFAILVYVFFSRPHPDQTRSPMNLRGEWALPAPEEEELIQGGLFDPDAEPDSEGANETEADGSYMRALAEAALKETSEPVLAEKGTDLISFTMLGKTRPDEKRHPSFPPELIDLDGSRVRMYGFMTPYDSLESMGSFMLFAYPTGCFFCAAPDLTEVVFVRQARGKDTRYIGGMVEVEGTLRLWRSDSDDPAHRDNFLAVIDKASAKKRPRK